MCSVIGYIGSNLGKSYVLDGLARLEYRGYDSAGFACINIGDADSEVKYYKSVGGYSNLVAGLEDSNIDGQCAMGQTRWSTHGAPSVENAHPHFDCSKTISVIHNGIIENHHELRTKLKLAGHVFKSQTDTEIVAHLFEQVFADNKSDSKLGIKLDIKKAAQEVFSQLDGAYAFVFLFAQYPDLMVVARKRSPLCIGLSDSGNFVASDFLAFVDKTNKVVFMPDSSFAILKKDSVELYDFSGKTLPINISQVDFSWNLSSKGNFEHYMLKEIYEQNRVVRDTVNFLKNSYLSGNIWENLGISKEQVKNLKSINFVACGTSWHAGKISQFFFESISKIPTESHLASELRYKTIFDAQDVIYMAISQSGETADTLEAIRLINSRNMKTIALTNVGSSSLVRETSGFLLMQAGQEIAVASTKAFTAQVANLYWLANLFALEKGLITQQEFEQVETDLIIAAESLESGIEKYKLEIIQELAQYYSKFKNFIFLGRAIGYPFALEAALKLKEITYCFAETYPAGELKHGAIALIEPGVPVFLFSSLDPIIYTKLVANAQEVKARKGHLVVVAFEGQDELCELADKVFILPKVKLLLEPLAMTGLMQFFAYQVAKELGRTIDKPRNLAKSVTVE